MSMQVDPIFDLTINSMAPIEAIRMEGFWWNKINSVSLVVRYGALLSIRARSSSSS